METSKVLVLLVVLVLRALLKLTTPITCGSYNTNTGNENKMLFVWIGRFYTQLTQVGRENLFIFPSNLKRFGLITSKDALTQTEMKPNTNRSTQTLLSSKWSLTLSGCKWLFM